MSGLPAVSRAFDRLRSAGAALRDPFEGPNTMGNSTAFWLAFAAFVGLLATYPSLSNPYLVGVTSQYLALAFLGMSLCFVWGYCGILSFGQVAFFGVGGYAFGIVAINATSGSGISLAIPGVYTFAPSATSGVTLAIPAALVFGTAFAAALGYFMFYGGVRDVYVTITTLVVALVLNTFMGQTAGSEWAIGRAQLGGFNGMPGIPKLTLGFGSTGVAFEGVRLYYLLLVTLVATYLLLRVLVNSSFGMTMVAVREDEQRTQTFGYDVAYVKLVAFTVGGALAALSGVFYVGVRSYIDPSVFAIGYAALPVVWVSVGGRKSLLGAIVATIGIQRMQQGLTDGLTVPLLGLQLGSEWALVIVGGLLLVVILAMPDGAAPYAERGGQWVLDKLEDRSIRDTVGETPE